MCNVLSRAHASLSLIINRQQTVVMCVSYTMASTSSAYQPMETTKKMKEEKNDRKDLRVRQSHKTFIYRKNATIIVEAHNIDNNKILERLLKGKFFYCAICFVCVRWGFFPFGMLICKSLKIMMKKVAAAGSGINAVAVMVVLIKEFPVSRCTCDGFEKWKSEDIVGN